MNVLLLFFKKSMLFTFFLLGSFSVLYAQELPFSGSVKNEQGQPLSGASVHIKGTSNAVTTDEEGHFSIVSAKSTNVIVVSYVGMVTAEFTVQAGTEALIVLHPTSTTALDEVVVVGYGTVRKKDLTGAIGTIKSKELTQVATPDVVQAMQGRVAGVNITANSGEPGSGMKIRIRGLGSINGGNPIYVVDGYQTSDISYLGPNDIENIDILKDASATAIYGSRGANGVVMITTKKGKTGPAKFTVDTYTGYQEAWRHLPMTNATQYAQLVLEGYANDGQTAPSNMLSRLQFVANGNYKGTDWQDEVMQKGIMQNYTLSMSGGTDKNKYRLSGTYFDQDGIIKNTGMKKYFVNFNNDYKVNKWFKAGISANFIHYEKIYYNGDYYSGVLTNALAADPMTPVWDNTTNNWGRADISAASNPARVVDFLKNNKGYGTNLTGNIYAEAQITKELSFRTQFGATYVTSHNKSYSPQFFVAVDEQSSLSSLSESRGESSNWLWTSYFNYAKTIGSHSFSVMAGGEMQNYNYNGMNVTAYNVPPDADLQYLSASQSTDYTIGSGQNSSALRSYFGRLNYNYKDRYLFTGTIRNDGSSKFLGKSRFGTFPSFAAAWNIYNEPFMRDQKIFSQLKLRAGWGQVGNEQGASNYGYATSVSGNNLYVFNDAIVQGYAPTTLSNPELKWEINQQTNIGLDAGFFNNNLTVTVDYFNRKTKDMIVAVPIPIYVGAGAPIVNAGSMQNKGWEVTVNYGGGHKFQYNFSANASFIKNNLTSLGGGPAQNSGSVGKLGNTTVVQEGMPVPYFFGLKTDGIFHSDEEANAYVDKKGNKIQPNAGGGDVKFVDTNGDGVIDDKDRVNLGNPYPKIQYGFNMDLSYQGFDLRAFFQGVAGNKVVNNILRSTENITNSDGGWTNFSTDRLNRWSLEHPDNNEPKMTVLNANNNMRFSDRYVKSGSYMRLKNLQIGYTLPAALTNRYKVTRLRIYVAADNLLTWTKYNGFDPEISDYYSNVYYYGIDVGNYPQARTFRFGVNLFF